MTTTLFTKLNEKYPFISLISYGDNEHIGIIQNKDEVITSFYDFSLLKDEAMKKVFLELAEQWWWESNRLIPINIFLKADWQIFKCCLRSFNSKDVILLHGPYVSLGELAAKKSKRRSITLVRKIT
jgi:hypothetical protein